MPQEYKKFVFKINAKHVDFIESMSVDERNLMINTLLAKYTKTFSTGKQVFDKFKKTKKINTIIGLIIIGIPCLYLFHLASKSLAEINFNIMQNYFVDFFDYRDQQFEQYKNYENSQLNHSNKENN